MWPVAILLIGVVLFYWFSFCLTIIALLKTLSYLCFGNFIRAALWFCTGAAMLIWWDGRYSWDHFVPLYAVIVGVGATATLLRYLNRIIPPRTKPFKLRRSGYKEPANDNQQLVTFSLHVKND
jgi:hypothetical protein